MSKFAASGTAVFRPRARLLKLIGAELISDDVVAVAELVKNAHDADASVVTIRFRGVTERGGEIIVEDDGCGMSLDDLLERWMQPAGSSKGRGGRRVSDGGRRMLGEKGVGRFAADKLGRHLELVSRKGRSPDELVAVFDWDEFDVDDRMLGDVRHRWQVRRASAIARRGTRLRISELRSCWNERMFRRLTTRLSRLRSPFGGDLGFRIVIDSDEFPHYSGELVLEFLERAPYRIDVSFDGSSTIWSVVGGARPVEHRWNGNGPLTCGPLRARIFAFDLETEALARVGPRAEVRAWLRQWSGISLYRDGFRVWPYGEPDDDWLRLDQRRVNNPTLRFSNNQLVGFVEIGRDTNPDLVDQTNREGLVHNPAQDDLKRFLYFALQLLEAERLVVRRPPRRVVGRLDGLAAGDQATVQDALERLSRKAPPGLAAELNRLALLAREEATRVHRAVHSLESGYAELAAVGQAALELREVMAPLLVQIREEVAAVRNAPTGKGAHSIKDRLRRIEAVTETLEKRVEMFSPLEVGSVRRRRVIDVRAELNACRDLFAPLLESAGAAWEIEAPRELIRVDMGPESFAQIMHILLTNSLDWMNGERRRRVKTILSADDEWSEVLFSDSGPGIRANEPYRIFEPLFSTKEGGRGMGLTIARSIVRQHGGELLLDMDARRTGANLLIRMPRRRSRSTMH